MYPTERAARGGWNCVEGWHEALIEGVHCGKGHRREVSGETGGTHWGHGGEAFWQSCIVNISIYVVLNGHSDAPHSGSVISPGCLVWSSFGQLNGTLDLSSDSNSINRLFYLKFACSKWALKRKITPESETSAQKPEKRRIGIFSPCSCLDFSHLARLSIFNPPHT